MTLQEKILVLRIFKHGEADLIIHGLNPVGAKMSFFAKGAAKSRKRFPGGILEPTHYIEVTYKPKTSEEADPLHTLLEARMVRDFPGLRSDYGRIEAALYLLKVVQKLGQQGTVDSPDLFNLLGNALHAIETSSNLGNLKLQFEIKLLAGQGILPYLDEFTPWLETGLANHEKVVQTNEDRQRAAQQAQAHLRQYLGEI